ncbi:3-hydroxyacyl-CoA dehydrogenase NAD-binding domain-containing protein [Ovoidimarina sediminis]|uniref:3-hydroxyacyl-CoA dehydrogenase NAD-binding domain-containing protein n=1 Tax=Ovoidimarina sediminis TaxID=3079856 RepID=UPI002910E82C|nr:3-hydroxyacyl-CoA dehydrogenase NAD-binding domain-containing protein [Rhodophyticola sp. MJ-SS7]MDU8946558.1 3-hydroxyacyl-CoA dehydrogenase NAD-binding domain-containing protein [Rhodophyticola sp. MJ-SS7]
MERPVTVQSTEGISVLTIDHPPANALSAAVVAALTTALAETLGSSGTRAIVLAARGKTFPAGIDIRDFDEPERTAALGELCLAIERAPVPVIAAVHGTILGGGLELAMAAHYRLADRRAQFGLPDAAVGLCPGAGGTQRLPRLVGAGPAIDLLLTGRTIGAADAKKIGLIDEVAEGPLPIFAMKWVKAALGTGLAPRPVSAGPGRLADKPSELKAIETRRAALKSGAGSLQERIVDCVQAAMLLPFEAALTFERTAFEDLAASPASRALRHVFIAERRARTPPLDDPAPPLSVTRIGIFGAGLTGTGISAACLDAGFDVTLVDPNLERLEAGVDNIIDIYDRQEKRGRINAATRDARIARLQGKTDPAALADAELVIETMPEDADAKRRAFAILDAVMPREAILATNTATIDIDGLAAGTGRAPHVVGLHFLTPAHVIRLVEVVVAMETTDAVIATAFAVARKLRKVPILSAVSEGFVTERLLGAYQQAAEYLVEDGATIAGVDAAMRAYGFPIGPFQLADLSGLDEGDARRARYAAAGARKTTLAARLQALGRDGRRAGRGFHLYDDAGEILRDDPEVTHVIAEMRALSQRAAQNFAPDDIQRRCLAAMANEGARIMGEEVAQRPSDIDLAAILGFGFPRWRGGPMMAADLTGLLRVKRDLDAYAGDDPAFWSPAPLFSELVKNGRAFGDLNDA